MIDKDESFNKKLQENDIDVTVSTSNRNVSDKLQRCIDSVLNAYEELNYEWFIFDNNSQDKDFNEIIRKYSKYKRITFIKNEKDEGLAAFNKIIDIVSGRYWMFLDADTVHRGKPIEELIKFMDSHPNAGMATAMQFKPDGSPLLYINRSFDLAKVFLRQTIIGRAIDHLLLFDKMRKYHSYYNLDITRINQIDQAVFACTMVRTEIVRKDGYVVDPDLTYWYNDVDLCKRVRDRGYKIYLVPSAKIIHDQGSSYKTTSRVWNRMIMTRGLVKYFRKYHRKKLLILKLIILSEVLILMINNKLRRRSNKELFWKFRKTLIW